MRFKFACAMCLIATRAAAINADDLSITTGTVRPCSAYAVALYSVRNNGTTRMAVPEVSCSVYDKPSDLIGTGTTVICKLKPSETGSTKALIDLPQASLRLLGKAVCQIVYAR